MGALFGAVLAALIKARQARMATTATPAALTIPAGPAPKFQSATGDMYAAIRKRRRAGRSGTIVTGDLEPMDLGKRTLLG